VVVEPRASPAPAGPPLVLAASKSWLGHSEPAAGMVGMLHAACAISRALAPPNAHLIHVNIYVEAVLRSCPGGQVQGSWSLPRQHGGLPAAGSAGAGRTSGTSAFAFQVTPAAVVAAPSCCIQPAGSPAHTGSMVQPAVL